MLPLLYYFGNVPDGRGADGRAPEIAELGPAHGNAAELSGNQAAAVLTGRRISAPAIRRVFEAHEAISSKFTRI